jgi:hypothetical protein
VKPFQNPQPTDSQKECFDTNKALANGLLKRLAAMQPRPQTLAEVAARADSLVRFGRELADWLHTVRTLGSRLELARTIETAPRVVPSAPRLELHRNRL